MGKKKPQRITLGIASEVNVAASLGVSVQKSLAVIVRGYREAVSRLEKADRRSDPDGVHIALTEASNWLDSLEEQTSLSGDAHVQAVLFARQRSHHHWGSITYRDDAGVFRWRPASQLPPELVRPKHEKPYARHLAGQPVLDVFRRIEPLVAGLDT